jgi:hypothetical protein
MRGAWSPTGQYLRQSRKNDRHVVMGDHTARLDKVLSEASANAVISLMYDPLPSIA